MNREFKRALLAIGRAALVAAWLATLGAVLLSAVGGRQEMIRYAMTGK